MTEQIIKFKPANDAQGADFITTWCCTCRRTQPCDILARTACLPADHPEYPGEWRLIQRGEAAYAVCTAHTPQGQFGRVTAPGWEDVRESFLTDRAVQ